MSQVRLSKFMSRKFKVEHPILIIDTNTDNIVSYDKVLTPKASLKRFIFKKADRAINDEQ
ncbi:hypothetical protein SS50377_24239 [Spironucleus salmonicida]|uniref:Uncharacterized protein n=1 Tax=Spironucleus salmonicida TaxID=348837 RepID=V6LUB5_9EUKA|nr:hypothetical protein SS50377_24224 [Spironucleus salmonicida]KAH0574285.1 hypothetical protein SS50377_24239 [Spironucleus salmonicida]|eukprot:EST47853.1 Hypothetical protein SS50377_12044 [Spironucleus salmonicida]